MCFITDYFRNKRIPAFVWPGQYGGKRLMTMRYLELAQLRQDMYQRNEYPQWSATHKDYLKNLAEQIMKDPKGERTMMDWHLFSSGWVNPYDTIQAQPKDAIQNPDGSLTELKSIWLTHGMEFTKQKLDYVFGALKTYGLELDYYTTQHEWSLTVWHLSEEQMIKLPQDPRWNAEETGFKDLTQVINFFESAENRAALTQFNAYLDLKTYEALEYSVYSVARKYWPNIKITDYSHGSVLPTWRAYDGNGWPLGINPKGNPWPGTCSDLHYLSGGQMYQYEWVQPEEIRPFSDTPWKRFLHSINTTRALSNSCQGKPFHPEFAGYDQLKAWGNLQSQEMYREHIFHAALTGADALQFWQVSAADTAVIDGILQELDGKISGRREGVYPYEIDWQAEELRTSLKVNGKIITRVTAQDFSGRWEVSLHPLGKPL